MFLQKSNWETWKPQKGPPIMFFSFLPYLYVSVVAPTWLIIIKREMACYISYVKQQLFKDAAV